MRRSGGVRHPPARTGRKGGMTLDGGECAQTLFDACRRRCGSVDGCAAELRRWGAAGTWNRLPPRDRRALCDRRDTHGPECRDDLHPLLERALAAPPDLLLGAGAPAPTPSSSPPPLPLSGRVTNQQII